MTNIFIPINSYNGNGDERRAEINIKKFDKVFDVYSFDIFIPINSMTPFLNFSCHNSPSFSVPLPN